MKLIAFSKQYLRLHDALPFGIRDAGGRLLLAAGQRVESRDRLAELMRTALFADEAESSDWRRRLAATVNVMIRQNVSLKTIADARPTDVDAGPGETRTPVGEQWTELVQALDGALREPQAEPGWIDKVEGVHRRLLQICQRGLDASLYHLIYAAGSTTERYSSQHAVLCCAISGEAARLLGWDAGRVGSLERAALTMNVAMRRLQDDLAARDLTLTDAMRAQIKDHAARGVVLLESAGVSDALWLQIVRLHHDDGLRELSLAELDAPAQAARLLRRIDIFAAKLSRRVTRAPMSPVQAAREACLGANGQPDEIGSVLLKAVGLYPPGSFVELVSGEKGIVVSRGRRANLPLVAALVGASGAPLGEPALRDTVERRHAVRGAIGAQAVRVIPPHERLLALL